MGLIGAMSGTPAGTTDFDINTHMRQRNNFDRAWGLPLEYPNAQ